MGRGILPQRQDVATSKKPAEKNVLNDMFHQVGGFKTDVCGIEL